MTTNSMTRIRLGLLDWQPLLSESVIQASDLGADGDIPEIEGDLRADRPCLQPLLSSVKAMMTLPTTSTWKLACSSQTRV